MLCITNSQFLPSAWSAYLQCYHRALFQAHENLLMDSSSKNRKNNIKKKCITDCSKKQNFQIQPSYIDRMIPAITLLGNDYQMVYGTKEPCFQRIQSKTFLQAKSPNLVQMRTFKRRANATTKDPTSIPTIAIDENSLKQVQNAVKSLNLNSREAMSFSLGMQESMKMKLSEKTQTKKNWLLRLFPLYVVAVVYITYKLFTLSSPVKDQTMDITNKRDFQAEIPDVTLDDVRGIDEVKQELKDVVEFLRDPEKFTSLGGKLPKGMLLSGPPGTGKTLLARAVAGEAGVPFFYASGAEFDEMFVGVGSSRVRSLFADAKENAPCIIFIDEIDACGSKRTSSPLAPYARLTINQLLQEMDGFHSKEGIIVLAATNMKEVLDSALTRPGRFDTEINVMMPDIKGRQEILQLYASRVVHGGDLDLEKIARLTGGMTGAALANLVNQAALRAGQLKKPHAEMIDFEFALDRLRMGPEMSSRVPTEAELELTAFHEAGHALIAYYTPNMMPIYKATVTRRGAALGHVELVPTREDETGSTSSKMLAQIDVCMGGRVAEEILKTKDHVTTGAGSDLQSATRIAFEYVCTYGMSDGLGFVAYDYEKASPQTKRQIEMEVRKLLENSYKKVRNILIKHSHQHKLLAKALFKYQTLSLEEIKTLLSTQNIKSVEKMRSNIPVQSSTTEVQGKKESIPSPI